MSFDQLPLKGFEIIFREFEFLLVVSVDLLIA